MNAFLEEWGPPVIAAIALIGALGFVALVLNTTDWLLHRFFSDRKGEE